MKKSVILILSVIYTLAIVFVGQMIKTQVYDPVVYVNKIEILGEEFKPYSDFNRVDDYYGRINLNYKEGLVYTLHARAKPYTATNTLLTYICEDKPNICTTSITDDNGVILKFKSSGRINITIKASDGSGVQAKIFVYAQDLSDILGG